MSFFPIPNEKFGTKHKSEIKLTPENRKAKKESTQNNNRAHTITKVKKQRKIMDQIAEQKINNIRRKVIAYHSLKDSEKDIDWLCTLCVMEGVFDDFKIAKMFIKAFKEKIFNVI